MTTHHAALIYTMVLMAAADRDMTDAEMHSIGDMVAGLPQLAHTGSMASMLATPRSTQTARSRRSNTRAAAG